MWQGCFFLLLSSRNFDDRLSSNFHSFVILCIYRDTPTVKSSLWQLPIVSTVFKLQPFCFWARRIKTKYLWMPWLARLHLGKITLHLWGFFFVCGRIRSIFLAIYLTQMIVLLCTSTFIGLEKIRTIKKKKTLGILFHSCRNSKPIVHCLTVGVASLWSAELAHVPRLNSAERCD